MDTSRRLYDEGFEGWDHSPAGYIMDYMIAVVGLVLAALVYASGLMSNAGAKNFVAYSVFTAVAFGGGGVAHHMLDIYFQNGEVMQKAWGEPNAGWMYAWLFTSVGALAAAAATGQAISLTRCGSNSCVYIVLYVMGGLACVYEIVNLVNENTDTTGAIGGYTQVLLAPPGLFASCCCIFNDAKCCIITGSCFWIGAMLFLLTVPASCKVVGEERNACPYPEVFNHNAIYHTIVITCLPFYYLAVKNSYPQKSDNWLLQGHE